MSLQWPPKDKDETLDFSLDWTRALESGETITTVVWKIVNDSGEKVVFNVGATLVGLTNVTQTNTSVVATVYLADGTDNKQYKLYCSITTNQGRVKERAVTIKIREYN
jgi:hypothetical protein